MDPPPEAPQSQSLHSSIEYTTISLQHLIIYDPVLDISGIGLQLINIPLALVLLHCLKYLLQLCIVGGVYMMDVKACSTLYAVPGGRER